MFLLVIMVIGCARASRSSTMLFSPDLGVKMGRCEKLSWTLSSFSRLGSTPIYGGEGRVQGLNFASSRESKPPDKTAKIQPTAQFRLRRVKLVETDISKQLLPIEIPYLIRPQLLVLLRSGFTRTDFLKIQKLT